MERHSPRIAQRAATKNTGLSKAASAPTKSPKKRSVGFQGLDKSALCDTCSTVIQPCCVFHITTGAVQRRLTNNASHGPGRRKWTRAGGHNQKKIAQQPNWNRLLYLLRNASPMASPIATP